jgi:opacity protein-like surface antigen
MRTASILTGGLLFFSFSVMAQDKTSGLDVRSMFAKGKYNIEVGAGAASYEGDLTEKTSFFGQPGYAASLGSSYNLSNKLSLGLGFSYLKLKADDKKNDKPVLKARNLNFESNVWDINLTLQLHPYTFGKLTPYIDGGIGLFHFNPTTVDRYGTKQHLASLGTEGQGMANPDNSFYIQTQVQIPFGLGVQYALNKRMALKLDFLFRKTFTDYIDDVSTTYPDGTLIDKKLPIIKQLSFRGDEINPSAIYPSRTQRGNADNKDFYYTGQIKFVYQLNKKLL